MTIHVAEDALEVYYCGLAITSRPFVTELLTQAFEEIEPS
jgi:hypothetical protein